MLPRPRRVLACTAALAVVVVGPCSTSALAAGETGTFTYPLATQPVGPEENVTADVGPGSATAAEVRVNGATATGCDSSNPLLPMALPPGNGPQTFQCTWDTSDVPEVLTTLELWVDNGDGLVHVPTADIMVTPDRTPPSGGSITPPNATQTTTSVDVPFVAGTDTHPMTLRLERQEAPLTGTTCGAWSSFASIFPDLRPTTSPYTDATLATDTCYRYRAVDTDEVGNASTYTSSNVVRVQAATPPPPPNPTLSLALSASGFGAKLVDGTMYYNPAMPTFFGPTQIMVTATPAAGSGTYTSVAFPDPDGAASGWTPSGFVDTEPPFETTYSFTAGAAAAATQTVLVTDANGQTATASFTITADTAPPTGVSITPTLRAGTSEVPPTVSVAFNPGLDAAGLLTWSVTRAVGTLTGDECTAFTAHAAVGGSNPASALVDADIAEDRCYAYRIMVIDGVGNVIARDADRLVIVDEQVDRRAGTSGDDKLTGTSGDELFLLGPGNDVLSLRAGNDQARGGAGSDRISGNTGDDCWLSGGADADTLFGGPGGDCLSGDGGDDTAHGGTGVDQVHGGFGNDTLTGGTAADEVSGGPGNDRMGGGFGDDELRGGDGDDSLYGHDGNDTITAGRGGDSVYGGPGDDDITTNLAEDEGVRTTYVPNCSGMLAKCTNRIGLSTTQAGAGDDTLDLTVNRDDSSPFTVELGTGNDHATVTLEAADWRLGELTVSLECGAGRDVVSFVRTPKIEKIADGGNSPLLRLSLALAGIGVDDDCEVVRFVKARS